MTLLYKADPERGRIWQDVFRQTAPEIEFRIWPDRGPAEDIRYLAAWTAPAELVAGLPNLEVLFSTGAGIDQFDMAALPPSVSVVRMIEPGITEGMVEYAAFAALALHRHMLDYRQAQQEARWQPIKLVPAASRRIGVMGLGNLGQAVLAALKPFGFPLRGWSRSGHAVEGVQCFAGQAQFAAFLAGCDILLCLVPLTEETRGILCRETFESLPEGAGLVNVGRGGHLCEPDLLAALDSGRLSGAVLDVMTSEPPPQSHPFWRHPRILMTPHVASMTQPETAAHALIANIRRHRNGQPMHGLVHRARGY